MRHNLSRIILFRVVDDITVGLRQIDYWQFIIFNISHAASLIAKSISGAVSNLLFITKFDQQSPRSKAGASGSLLQCSSQRLLGNQADELSCSTSPRASWLQEIGRASCRERV